MTLEGYMSFFPEAETDNMIRTVILAGYGISDTPVLLCWPRKPGSGVHTVECTYRYLLHTESGARRLRTNTDGAYHSLPFPLRYRLHPILPCR